MTALRRRHGHRRTDHECQMDAFKHWAFQEFLPAGDPQTAARRFGQLLRAHGRVRIGDAPECLGIVHILRGDVIQALTFADDM